MTFETLSEKQKTLLRRCYAEDSPYSFIISDRAVRSGKTSVRIVSFILWAMRFFDGANFAVCGKTVRSAKKILSFRFGQATIFLPVTI